jgi:hypothetical protein
MSLRTSRPCIFSRTQPQSLERGNSQWHDAAGRTTFSLLNAGWWTEAVRRPLRCFTGLPARKLVDFGNPPHSRVTYNWRAAAAPQPKSTHSLRRQNIVVLSLHQLAARPLWVADCIAAGLSLLTAASRTTNRTTTCREYESRSAALEETA